MSGLDLPRIVEEAAAAVAEFRRDILRGDGWAEIMKKAALARSKPRFAGRLLPPMDVVYLPYAQDLRSAETRRRRPGTQVWIAAPDLKSAAEAEPTTGVVGSKWGIYGFLVVQRHQTGGAAVLALASLLRGSMSLAERRKDLHEHLLAWPWCLLQPPQPHGYYGDPVGLGFPLPPQAKLTALKSRTLFLDAPGGALDQDELALVIGHYLRGVGLLKRSEEGDVDGALRAWVLGLTQDQEEPPSDEIVDRAVDAANRPLSAFDFAIPRSLRSYVKKAIERESRRQDGPSRTAAHLGDRGPKGNFGTASGDSDRPISKLREFKRLCTEEPPQVGKIVQCLREMIDASDSERPPEAVWHRLCQQMDIPDATVNAVRDHLRAR